MKEPAGHDLPKDVFFTNVSILNVFGMLKCSYGSRKFGTRKFSKPKGITIFYLNCQKKKKKKGKKLWKNCI